MPASKVVVASVALAVASFCSAPIARAQVPPAIAVPTDVATMAAVPQADTPAGRRWRLGTETLQGGDKAAALQHLLLALEFHPASAAILQDIVRAAPDAAVRAFWLDRLVRAGTDAQGRFDVPPALKKELAADELAAQKKLSSARLQAASELARALDRCKASGPKGLGNGALAAWLATAFVEFAAESPALLAQHGPAFAAALQRGEPEYDLVVKGLLAVAQGRINGAATAGEDQQAMRNDLALRAARILRGLARQAAFGKDLKGAAPPALGDLAATAAAAEAAARTAIGEPHVWSIAELEAMDTTARDAFTLAHREPGNPGVALSPTGKYRLETVCGHETLLGVAKTIELHHARLAHHFGSDPFENRQGTVVIVPEVHDLEIEGAPYWWAGGFQGGDRTVLRFAWSDIGGLGHGLTHELTHRFDGTLRPFLKAWYGEGHASWTGAHFGQAAETEFTENWLDLGACAGTAGLGYGAEDKLKKLLTGDMEEYRDNYTAGYTLYAFLRGYPPAEPPRFAAALAHYEAGARAGQKDPVGWFEKCFCDGKGGRPADFAGFVAQWQQFLDDIGRYLDEKRRDEKSMWVARYGRLPEGDKTRMVQDEPTWSWARTRAEPFFGQGHAGRAGAVLAAAGLREAAAAAYLWSLQCEGWQLSTAGGAVAALDALPNAENAAALRQLTHLRFPAVVTTAATSPLPAKMPKLVAYRDALLATAGAMPKTTAIAAAALQGEAMRLSALLGAPIEKALEALPPPPVPHALGGGGYVEDSLTGHDDDRTPGMWYPTIDGDLHVGRERPRNDTGGLERTAHRRPTFVRGVEWLPPGEHVVRFRVHFTTAFSNGSIVLGHWRRDRDLRLSFSGGDWDYAVGRSKEEPEYDRVDLHLEGLWERDGQMPETGLRRTVHFESPSASFGVELRIRGPTLLVVVDGEPVFRYATPDGAPIEGHLGFASSNGAFRVQEPTVQRLDRCAPGAGVEPAIGLDIAVQPTLGVDDLEHRPTRGLPTSPVGGLVLWLPKPAEGDEVGAQLDRALPALAKLLQDRVQFPQPWTLAIPAGTSKERRAAIEEQIRAFVPQGLPVVEHQVGPPFTGNPWVMFVDAAAVLRAAAPLGDPRLHGVVQKWARMFRAR